ncbi:hypothetical protein ACMA1D_08775 [Streptomyces sp. 796.1]|uniref:hypothetical protein n=1 Tax=Streptomyces sp. 796.1 TaxID=3163029 RepID=UPI0039C93D45
MAERSGYQPRTCLALDVQAYGARNDHQQSDVQHELLRMLSRAALMAGVDRSQWLYQAQGDGQLAVLPMDGSEPLVVDGYVRQLTAVLREHNHLRLPAARIRLRAAVHHGPVEPADNGFAGRAVVTTCRLRDSAVLRHALVVAPDADLVLALSDSVFHSTVGGGHTSLGTAEFRRIDVVEKEFRAPAWLWVPGHDVHGLPLTQATAPSATTADPYVASAPPGFPPLRRPTPPPAPGSPEPAQSAPGRPTPGWPTPGWRTPGSLASDQPAPGRFTPDAPTPGSPESGQPTPGRFTAGPPGPDRETCLGLRAAWTAWAAAQGHHLD